MTTNSKVNNYKVVKTLRKLYHNSRIATPFEEQRRVWRNIQCYCEKFGISEDLIIMDEEVFNEMSIPVIEHYYLN